jgi:hypothetical protein
MVVQAVKSAPAIDVTPEKAKGAAVGDKIRTAVQQKK